METYGEEDRSMAVGTAPSCVPAITPTKKQPSSVRKTASGCVFWIGMALIGIAAIPAGILFGIIRLLLKATSFLTDKIEKG